MISIRQRSGREAMRRAWPLVALAIAFPASAQIFSNSVIMGMGYTSQAAVSQQPVLHCLRNNCSGNRSAPRSAVAQSSPVALAFAGGPAPAFNGDASLKYTPSPQLAQQARTDFLTRLRSNNAEAAKVIDAEARRVNFAKIASDLLGAAGLRNDDAADALTFYTVLGYLIAKHDMSDPSPAMFKGVRSHIAPRLAADPRFRSPAERARLGEKMKFLTVILHAGWISAEKEKNLPQYSREVARLFQQQGGVDMRSVRLTDLGLVRR